MNTVMRNAFQVAYSCYEKRSKLQLQTVKFHDMVFMNENQIEILTNNTPPSEFTMHISETLISSM